MTGSQRKWSCPTYSLFGKIYIASLHTTHSSWAIPD
ncbi:unnamed protein product [Spirodela intermedia]|uniref:Uncharacterized protein n=1 Tax=Spirodela intermedia TaxID=51605 RepID=A0A7I8JAT5_SPIIN|nr:unnamed protein product [Spirodela intermedia]CAA6667316.1 unnamed protein product [Spirodela intermedia]